VKVCHSNNELVEHAISLFQDSPAIMIEEYLSGEEANITGMPPSSSNPEYWTLPIVTRFDHPGGVAPYNGIVAVTANLTVVSQEELERGGNYAEAARECEQVARLLKVAAPIRIDIRRFKNEPGVNLRV